jgi:hypothetical protein
MGDIEQRIGEEIADRHGEMRLQQHRAVLSGARDQPLRLGITQQGADMRPRDAETARDA